MKNKSVTFFSAKQYEKDTLIQENKKYEFKLNFINQKLSEETAILAKNSNAVVCFVNDVVDKPCVDALKKINVSILMTRSSGYNHIDIDYARKKNIICTNIPDYSPNTIAEFSVGLLLSLARKIHIAHKQTCKYNFSLDNLVGSTLSNKTIGVIGTGKIGSVFSKIMHSFNCSLLLHDISKNTELEQLPNTQYVSKKNLLEQSNIISLHIPLNKHTHYFISKEELCLMKKTALIVNTARGGLINSNDLLWALNNNIISGAALDVYENEKNIFFNDFSKQSLNDSILKDLIFSDKCLITSHQSFLSQESLQEIAKITFQNLSQFFNSNKLEKKYIL